MITCGVKAACFQWLYSLVVVMKCRFIIFSQAEDLAKITGAEVHLRVKNVDTGKEYRFKSCPIKKRDVAVQHVAMQQTSTPTRKSTTSDQDTLLNGAFSTPNKILQRNIQFLPGKSTEAELNASVTTFLKIWITLK